MLSTREGGKEEGFWTDGRERGKEIGWEEEGRMQLYLAKIFFGNY